MDSIKRHPVFLVLLWIGAARCVVEPPTNVTLHCHNLQNTLEWRYGNLSPGLRFKVEIRSYYNPSTELWVDPPHLQADLSSFSDPRDSYLVSVSAVMGQNESAPQGDITYSYLQNSDTSQTCFVDLPPVNVTAHPENNIVFRFVHPWLWYHPPGPSNLESKQRKKKSHSNQQLPLFKYSVVVVNKEYPHHYSCMTSVCEQKLPVDALQEKHCLNISGELNNMAVKSTQLHCAAPVIATPPASNKHIVYAVVSALMVCVALFVMVMVYKKKTRPKTERPNSISIRRTPQDSMATVPEQVTVMKVEVSSPAPLISNEEQPHFTGSSPSSDSPVLRLRAGLIGAEEAPDEGHGYLWGGSLDEDEPQDDGEALSGYEKRPVLVDMGSDELVEAYRS